jgi:RNA polymerase sigma factor (sigma-70 family)
VTADEFRKTVDEYGPRLLQFAIRHTGDVDLAKDLVQETFIALMGKIGDVEPVKSKPFLFAVINNKIKDFYKLRKNTTEIMDFHKTDQARSVEYENREIVNMALARLEPKEKQLIILRDLEGYDYEEIGKTMRLSPSQVKVYLFRARKLFKEQVIRMEVYYEQHNK